MWPSASVSAQRSGIRVSITASASADCGYVAVREPGLLSVVAPMHDEEESVGVPRADVAALAG